MRACDGRGRAGRAAASRWRASRGGWWPCSPPCLDGMGLAMARWAAADGRRLPRQARDLLHRDRRTGPGAGVRVGDRAHDRDAVAGLAVAEVADEVVDDLARVLEVDAAGGTPL